MRMRRYQDLGKGSGVDAYCIGDEMISVRFIDGTTYDYTYASTGRDNVEQMKALARAGRGLAHFIKHNVRGNFERQY
ncbi:MAG: hypothetical protein V4633_00490 [Pseudomonadota bacterium]